MLRDMLVEMYEQRLLRTALGHILCYDTLSKVLGASNLTGSWNREYIAPHVANNFYHRRYNDDIGIDWSNRHKGILHSGYSGK